MIISTSHELLTRGVAGAGACSRPSCFPFLLRTLAYQTYVNVESNHRTDQLSGVSLTPLNEHYENGLPYDHDPRDKIIGLRRLATFSKLLVRFDRGRKRRRLYPATVS